MRLLNQLLIIIVSCCITAVSFAEGVVVSSSSSELPNSNRQVVTDKVMQKTDLNKASAQELLLVKGLNTSKVRAIITYRKKNKGFKSLDELSQVKGMKRLKSDEMKVIQEQLKL